MEESVQRVGSSLKKKLEEADLRRRPPTDRITRVPDRILKFDADAYEPQLISIGPYHYGKPRLQPMDEFKLQCTRMILRRNSDTVLERYVEEIKLVELEARSFYSEDTNNIGTDAFVMMMLLDGCFIVQLLLMFEKNEENEMLEHINKNEETDEMLEHMGILGTALLAADMIMLENQIPFFVIQKIFDLAGGSRKASLVTLALGFLEVTIAGAVLVEEWSKVPFNGQVHHLLHLFHTSLNPARLPESGIRTFDCNMSWLRWAGCSTDPDPDPEQPLSFPSATALDQAGVKIRRKNNVKCFLDISFNGRTLEIPQVMLYDETVLILRNLVAFEQCYPKIAGSYVTMYSDFMDNIIDTAEDVALLQLKEVIVNGLGNNEDGAALFNKLGKGVIVNYDDCYLADVYHNLKSHCKWRPNEWRAKLMRDYFNNPWSSLSLLGAFILLILTAFQTGYLIQGYYHAKS